MPPETPTETNDAPSSLTALADKILAWREAESNAEEILKKIKAERDAAEQLLIDQMLGGDLDRFTHAGKTFYRRIQTNVSIAERPKLFEWLKANGQDALITETINAKTLNAWWKEIAQVPAIKKAVEPMLKIYEAVRLGVRQG